jgi:AraC-like DNA-binding protein
MQLTCLMVASETVWLTERLHGFLPPGQRVALSVLEGAHENGGRLPDLIATDDLRHPDVSRVVRRHGRPPVLSVVVVLSWDDPLHLSALVGVGSCRAFTLPDQAEAALLAIEMLAANEAGAEASLQFTLPPEWPGGLRLAVNRIQRCLDDAAAAPPPSSVAELARRLGISRPNLSRSATDVGFPLRPFLDAVRVRWAVARCQAGYPVEEVATDLGFARVDSLARLAKRVTGRRWSEVRRWQVARLDREVLGPVWEAGVGVEGRPQGS